MTTIRAHFDGQAIILDEPANLPINKPLRIRVETEGADMGTAEQLANSELFGLWKNRTDIASTEEFARKLRKEGETRRHEIHDSP